MLHKLEPHGRSDVILSRLFRKKYFIFWKVLIFFVNNCTLETRSYIQLFSRTPRSDSQFINEFCISATSSSIKALTIGPILMAISQFTGAFTMMNYAGTIFKESGSTIDPNVSSIVLGLVQICGSIFCIAVVDKVGRKTLLIISTLGCSIGLFVMGAYSFLSKHDYDISSLNLVPVISLSFVIFISSVGLSPVPHIMVAEILSLKVNTLRLPGFRFNRENVNILVTSLWYYH